MATVTNAERWIEIMKELCQKRFVTMSYLAEKHNVSRRTIQRDMYSISRLMPIEIRQGRNTGGIYVIDNYTMDKAYMTEEQINLLLKIKSIVTIELSDEEIEQFNYIINSYTRPLKK